MISISEAESSAPGFSLEDWLRTLHQKVQRHQCNGANGSCPNEETTSFTIASDARHVLVWLESNKGCLANEAINLRHGSTFKLKVSIEHARTITFNQADHALAWIRPHLNQDRFYKVDAQYVYTPVTFNPQIEPHLDTNGRETTRIRADCFYIANRPLRALLYSRI